MIESPHFYLDDGMPLRASLLILLVLGLLGCGAEPKGPPPTDQVKMLIADLPDSARKPERWVTMFAAGSAPTDSAKYGSLMLHAMDARLEGETGTVKVLVEDINGTKVGEVEWTVVQENGVWKIKTAPLP